VSSIELFFLSKQDQVHILEQQQQITRRKEILPTNHKRVKDCEEEECVGHVIQVLN
jgi:hypothetical protein